MNKQENCAKSSATEVKCKITRTSYDKIVSNVQNNWPQWKKNLCNQELIVSVKSKKL